MSLKQGTVARSRYQWRNLRKTSTGTLSGQVSEGQFSLVLSYADDSASFRWNDMTTPEINFVVDMEIRGEGGQILLNRSWEVTNLRRHSAVDLVYPMRMAHWTTWTRVKVEFRDVTRIGTTGKIIRSRCITKEEFQRSASMAAAKNVEVQSRKQSVPIKPVIKTELIGSTEDQVGPKSSMSAVDSGSFRQPQVKRQKLQTATAEISDLSLLREENRRLQRKLKKTVAELELSKQPAEMSQLQLKCDQLEPEKKTQLKISSEKFFQRNQTPIKRLSVATLSSTIRLANQLKSDGLMAECCQFVKTERANMWMWKNLRPIGAEFPDLFDQICAFSGSRRNAKLPKFHFSAIVNH